MSLNRNEIVFLFLADKSSKKASQITKIICRSKSVYEFSNFILNNRLPLVEYGGLDDVGFGGLKKIDKPKYGK